MTTRDPYFWVLLALGVPFAVLHIWSLWLTQTANAAGLRRSSHVMLTATGLAMLSFAVGVSAYGWEQPELIVLLTGAPLMSAWKARMDANQARYFEQLEWGRTVQLGIEYGLPVPTEDEK
jgi:hypothetical protein